MIRKEIRGKLDNGGRVGRVGQVEFLTRVDIVDPSNPSWQSQQYKAQSYEEYWVKIETESMYQASMASLNVTDSLLSESHPLLKK